MTGASGSVYARALVAALARTDAELHLVATAWAERVWREELGGELAAWTASLGPGRLLVHDPEDLAAPVSSGSFRLDGTVVVPCSSGTLGALAASLAGNLVQRAGSVALKEGWPLVLVTRETPLSLPALRAMVALKEAGAAILPACPGFYSRPSGIDELALQIAHRALDLLGSPDPGASRWYGGGEE